MSEINWDDLTEGWETIEAEAKANDERDPEARRHGIPLWAYRAWLDVLAAREEALAEAEGDDADSIVTVDEAAERFMDTFVTPLERAQAKVSMEGEPVPRPADLTDENVMHISIAGKDIFSLMMAVQIAKASLQAAGPLALGIAGLVPNAGDAMRVMNLAGALQSATTLVMDSSSEVQSIEAVRS